MRTLAVVLVAATMLFSSGWHEQAQAGALSCLNALTGVKSAYQIGSEAADTEFLGCTAQMATGDVGMIASVAAIVGAGKAGAFKDKATCQNMITGQIGQLVADILVHSGPVADFLKKLLGDAAFAKLVEFAKGQATQNMSQIPGLQPVFRYLNCGCSVAAKADAVEKIGKEWFSDVKECSGFIGDVGGMVLDGIESGIDGIGEFFSDAANEVFGSPEETPDLNIVVARDCAGWVPFAKGATYRLVDGGMEVQSVERRDAHTTITNRCSCFAPGKFESQQLADGKVNIRCGCSQPQGAVYNSQARSCGCPANQRLENGACIACESERFSETATGTSVESGSLSNNVCKQISRTCPAGQKPVRAAAGYYYECKPVCAAGTIFVKAPGAAASAGSCQSCPKNSVPVLASVGSGQLQCQECPSNSTAKPGSTQCVKLDCPQGTDPNQPHACRPICALIGEGKNQRLACARSTPEGSITDKRPCPARMRRQGDRCVPELYHKPDLVIERPRPVEINPVLRNKQDVTKAQVKPKAEKRRKLARDKQRREKQQARQPGGYAEPALVDSGREPVERRRPQREEGGGYDGPDIGQIIELGIGIGQSLDLGSRKHRRETSPDTGTSETMSPSAPEPSAEPTEIPQVNETPTISRRRSFDRSAEQYRQPQPSRQRKFKAIAK